MTDTLRPRLVLLQGDRILAVREIPPDHEWVLGRRPDSPLPLNERSISRQHVRVYCDSAGTHLEDLGTPNGTWVDGAPLRGTVVLQDGQVMRLGQSTNPDPLLLRFEDPASRLLDTLARVPVEAECTADSSSARPDAAEEESAERGPSEVPSAPSVSPFLSESADAEGGGSAAPPPPEEPAPRPARPLFGLGVKAIAGAGLAFVAVFWLLWALKSTQKPWQSVRVDPLRAQTGSHVAIRGSEVEPADSLKVFVEDQEAPIEEAVPGSLVFTMPEVPGAEAGTRAVTLRVERRGIVVLRQSLQYETAPTIERIEPPEAAVGDVVAVIGSGFVSDASRVQVRVGNLAATVVSAAPRRLEVRVPVVTRELKVEAPVEVGVEGLRSAPAPLIVRRRETSCYALSFSARAASPRVFEVWHSFGPAVLVEGASGGASAESEWPPAVRQSIAALQAAFEAAPRDTSVRFLVQGHPPVLVATGVGGSPRVVARMGSAVTQLVRERLPELRQPELVLYWQAAILNDMLDLFARMQPPRILPASEPAGDLLRRLRKLNAETGGRGCPTDAEVETITGEERRVLETAAFRVPARFGDVGGTWQGSFEAPADQASQERLEMQLELEQAGTSLKGRMFLFEVRGPGIKWSPPPIEGLTGTVLLEGGTSVELRLPPVPPHDIVRLTATVADDAMAGTFRTSRGKQGRFQLAYKEK